MPYDNMGMKKAALNGVRKKSRELLGEDLKGTKDTDQGKEASVDVIDGSPEEESLMKGDTPAEDDADADALTEKVFGEEQPVEDIHTEDEGEITPELLARLLDELGG